jgi:HlyD family secretion protein
MNKRYLMMEDAAMKHYPQFIIVIVTLLLVLAGCGSAGQEAAPIPEAGEGQDNSAVISATGVVLPEQWAAMSARNQGVIVEVFVAEGGQVSAGQELVRLDGQEATAAKLIAAQQAYDAVLRGENSERARLWQIYMDAQKVREAAQKKWNDISLNDIENRIGDRMKDVEDRQVDLDNAQADFDKYKDLNRAEQKYREAEFELDAAQADYDEAVENLESTIRERDVPRAKLNAALAAEAEAKYQYEITLDGPNSDQLALAKSGLDAAQDAFDSYVITAPFDGMVCNLEARIGEWASPGMPLLHLGNLDNLRVETTDLSEIDAARVHPGDVVSVTFDALPEVMVQGAILRLADKSSESSGVNYTAVIQLDEIPKGLRWGMTAFADIEVSQ